MSEEGARDPLAPVFFAIGLLVPLLGGGNVLLALGPEAALPELALASAAASVLILAIRRDATLPAAPLLALAAFVAWWCGTLFLRPAGPRAGLETQGLLCGALLFAAFRHTGERDLAAFAAGLLTGAVGTAFYGQYQYRVMFPRILPVMTAAGRPPFLSVNANFYNANAYAGFLGGTVILASAFLHARRPLAVRLGAGIAIAFLAVMLTLTGSRAVVLLLIAGLGAAYVPQLRRPRLLAAGALLAAGVGWALSGWLALGELWSIATLGRLAIWRGATAMIADHWLLGVGIGRFAEFFDRYRVTDYYTRYPHDFLLEVFAETGIVGVSALSLFLATALAGAVAALRGHARRERGLDLFALSAALFLVAHALVDIDWHAPANPILLFALLGFLGRPALREDACAAR